MARPVFVAGSKSSTPIDSNFAATKTIAAHPCGTGPGRMVIAVVDTHSVSSGLTVTGVTCGGVAMTAGPSRSGGTEALWQLWWLAGSSLPSGNQAIVATLSSGATRPGIFAFNLIDADGGDLSLINGVTPAPGTITLTRTVTVSKTAAQSAFALMRQGEATAGTAVSPATLAFSEAWFPAITSVVACYERSDAASGSVDVQATWGSTAAYGDHMGFAVATTFGVDATPPTLTGAITVGTVTATSIAVTWPAGSDAVGVTSYEVSINGGSSWTDTGNTTTARTFTGLTASTSYTIQVRAKDAAGNVSTPALSVTQSTGAAGDTTLPVLTGTITVANITQTSFDLDWPPATDNVGITGYDYSLDGGTSWTPVLTDAVSVTGRTAGTTYAVRVRAVDGAGNLSTPVLSTSVTTAAAGATLTSSPLKNNTGSLLLGVAFEAFVHDRTTGALVLKKTGLTSNGSTGVAAFTDASLTVATAYRVVWRATADGAEGLETLTAS